MSETNKPIPLTDLSSKEKLKYIKAIGDILLEISKEPNTVQRAKFIAQLALEFKKLEVGHKNYITGLITGTELTIK